MSRRPLGKATHFFSMENKPEGTVALVHLFEWEELTDFPCWYFASG